MKAQIKLTLIFTLLVFVAVLAFVPSVAFTAYADEPEIEVTEVSSFGQLLSAVNADKKYIKLTKHIADDVPDDELPTKHRLAFDGGIDYTLDLGGYSLFVRNTGNEFYTDKFSMIGVSNGSTLEIKNGKVEFENYWADYRVSKGLISVEDTSTLVANDVNMRNYVIGPVVYADGSANVTLNGGEYVVQNGFALYIKDQANLTLNDGVYVRTAVGDSMVTVFNPGYGALYSESTGDLVINNALFKSGIQVHASQIDAFSVSTHEVVINGNKINEDPYDGDFYEAKQNNKEYYWYDWTTKALRKVDDLADFALTVRVISYDKKYPIEVINGTAKIGGVAVTEASYGQEVTIIADAPEEGMEFVRWGVAGTSLDNNYSATATFEMSAAPVTIEAYYGKLKVSSINATVGELVAGEKIYDTEITFADGVHLSTIEWYQNGYKMKEEDVVIPGKTYSFTALVYPPEDNMFANTVTATVNGNNANVGATTQAYVIFSYEVGTMPSVGFDVWYSNDSKYGIGGSAIVDTEYMADNYAEFNTALSAGEVTYQWYKDGVAIDGATASSYEFTAEDVESKFYVAVTANGKTSYGYIVECGTSHYKLYLNATSIVPAGKAPLMSSATPGVSIDVDSIVICEILGLNSYSIAMDMGKTILIPGKNYRLVGNIICDGVEIGFGSKVYVNGELMSETLDGIGRFYYDFEVPEVDFPVYYKLNGEVGIGVTISVDVNKMCDESTTFENAYDTGKVNYQWYKNGEPINGATNSSYTVTTKDKNSYINCKVTLVDGKYGVGEQYAISNVITVVNFNMPTPRNGDTIIKKGQISADGIDVEAVFWWEANPHVDLENDDTYVVGRYYGFYIQVKAKETFLLDFDGAEVENMTKAYICGIETFSGGSLAGGIMLYMTEDIVAMHVHQYSDDVWDSDEDGHWKPCIVPGCTNPNEEWENYVFHDGGDATCQTKGTCAVCGHEYYGEHDIAVSDYVYVDEFKCIDFCNTTGCDYVSSWEYHRGGVATCTEKATCEVCHHEYGDVLEHAGGTATCTARAKCTACGEEYGDMLEHDHGTAWVTSAEKHWKECDCGDKANEANHVDENADGQCDVCEYQMSTSGGEPGEPEPSEPSTPSVEPSEEAEEGLSAGAIAGIAVGSAVGASAIGFAIFWFLIKKKSFADLIAIFKK